MANLVRNIFLVFVVIEQVALVVPLTCFCLMGFPIKWDGMD